jgi:hypothetical protein
MGEHEVEPEVQAPEPEAPAPDEDEGPKYDGGPIPRVESSEEEN